MKVLALVTLLVFSTVPLTWSVEAVTPDTQLITDTGNKFCPVSGDKVSGKHFIEYGGKRYSMCCPMCKKDFNKNPEKYIASLENREQQSKSLERITEEHGHSGHVYE